MALMWTLVLLRLITTLRKYIVSEVNEKTVSSAYLGFVDIRWIRFFNLFSNESLDIDGLTARNSPNIIRITFH